MNTNKRLVLVDGSSYLYRAFHAMPDLRAVAGDPASSPTGAIRGMINMMNSLRKEQVLKGDDAPVTYGVCVFDAPGPTFRDALYPEYKATRSRMPEDLRSQIAPIHELVALMGWKVLTVPDVEADDVIATLAAMASTHGIEVIVSSGDKDLSQLVNQHITIIDTMNGKRRDVAGVTAEFGVPPSLMVDLQTLIGDAVDNVPGVEKVGAKTAAKWLLEYGSLDNLVAKAHEIKGVAGENLRKAMDWLPKGRALVTMKRDCDLSAHTPYVDGLPDFDALALQAENTELLAGFYEKYGFKSLQKMAAKPAFKPSAELDDLFADHAPEVATHLCAEMAKNYETIFTAEQLNRWVNRLQAAPVVALDTETDSIHDMLARLVGISFAVQEGAQMHAAYIPLMHNYPDAPAQLPMNDVLAALKPWLEDAAKPKVGQHIKYDRHVFATAGIEVKGYAHDTMLQSYVLEVHKGHGLESLAERHLGRKGVSFEDLCGKGAKQITIDQVAIERVATYACEDAEMTLAVHHVLWPRLESEPKLRAVYELEIASSEALFRMERNGVLIDGEVLKAQSKNLGGRIITLETQAHALAGQPFNLASPKQIGEIFFEKLGLPVVKKTATGAPSTDEEVLEKLALDYPLPAKLLEFRSLSKLKGTYTDKLATLANPRTGRVHTHYGQAVAVTGRLSSTDPNLQNIPVRTTEGRMVREAFIAASGNQIASADYSQIELRIMAHLSGDESLLAAFHNGLDVHKATAAEVFGVAVAAVSSEQRRYAKVINFGLIYGMSSFGLARNLGIETKAAAAYIDRYFQRYPGVKRYMDETRAQAKAQGYVETVMGRRLYLPEINSPNGPRRAGAERAAINAPMQGTAADLIKLSMCEVQRVLDSENCATKLIMQVHDELVFEVPEGEIDWLKSEIPRIMAGVATLKVPLLAEIGVGKNWDEAH
ncbi:MAG: DNA polymerase I [Cytophagales bacterium]|nr:DNA polymerase I [Cytophagales bacterium]